MVNVLNDKNISQKKSAQLRMIFIIPNAKSGFLMKNFNCNSHLPHISTSLERGSFLKWHHCRKQMSVKREGGVLDLFSHISAAGVRSRLTVALNLPNARAL